MNDIKYFVYTRKSTDSEDRQIRSIGDQLAELRELAQKLSLTVVDVFTESQTAKAPGRPIFNDMLERIKRGEASGILAWHPDRLARNGLDGGHVVHLIDTGAIKDLKFPTFWFEPTPQGKFMLAMAFGQSKYYVDNLAENVKRGHRQKLKNGIWPQFAPVGYVNDKTTRTIRLDPDRAPLVRKAFELYATGNYTFITICEKMNALGLIGRRNRSMSQSNYQYLLQNPFYFGVMRYKGEYYDGKHEPVVTKKLFDQAQEMIKRKSKPNTRHLKPYLYRGVFRCGECGCFITTETQKGHNYLHCTRRVKRDCSQPFIREEEISRLVNEAIPRFGLAEHVADEIIDELKIEQQQATDAANDAAREVHRGVQEVDEQLKRLMNALLTEAISLDEYQTTKKDLVLQKREREDNLAQLSKSAESWFEPAIRFVGAAKQAVFLTLSDNQLEKRDFGKRTVRTWF